MVGVEGRRRDPMKRLVSTLALWDMLFDSFTFIGCVKSRSGADFIKCFNHFICFCDCSVESDMAIASV